MDASPGLLGPAGEWYPCEFTEHSETAERIVSERFKDAHRAWCFEKYPWAQQMDYTPFGQFEYLGLHGWLHVDTDGNVSPMRGPSAELHPTQAQLDLLWDLFAAARDQESYMRHALEVFWKLQIGEEVTA